MSVNPDSFGRQLSIADMLEPSSVSDPSDVVKDELDAINEYTRERLRVEGDGFWRRVLSPIAAPIAADPMLRDECVANTKCPSCGNVDEIQMQGFLWPVEAEVDSADAEEGRNIRYELVDYSIMRCPKCGFQKSRQEFIG